MPARPSPNKLRLEGSGTVAVVTGAVRVSPVWNWKSGPAPLLAPKFGIAAGELH
jgi:hypothetical protein